MLREWTIAILKEERNGKGYQSLVFALYPMVNTKQPMKMDWSVILDLTLSQVSCVACVTMPMLRGKK